MAKTVARHEGRKERLEDILVVDCDVHVHESPGELAPYCEMPWRVALENIADVPEFYLDIPGFSPGTTAYEAKFPSGQEGTRMVHTAEQMRSELDEIHVDIGVLFPDHFLKIPVISQIDYAVALAREVGAEGITVNAISPGAFPTDAERVHPDQEALNRRILDQQSLKRRGTPEDVGNLAAFLASDAASFITGQTIMVDGGWAMH